MLFQLHHVTKTYGRVKALHNLSVQVPPGAVGLLGPNGAGKTTLIRTLLGLIGIDAGTGQVLGMDIRAQRLAIRQAVGFVPEDECLFPAVIGIEFVAYAGELGGMSTKDAMQRAHEVLDYVGLGEARYRRVESYSTGMKQRLKLASAIVHDPRLLILDEPTNGMDPAGREDILELSRDLAHNKGMSLLFSSHLLPDVEAVCEYVLVLGRGRLLAQGRIQELKQVHQRFYEVRLKANPEPFVQQLAAAGCSVEPRDDVLRVELPPQETPALLWRTAAELGQQIRHLRPWRSTLEEVFLNAVGEQAMPIFDQGYQHWHGELSGRPWRWLSIARHGVRAQFKNRLARFVILFAWIPALSLAAFLVAWGLVEQNSEVVAPLRGFLARIVKPQMMADPVLFRVTVWTLAYDTFFRIEMYFAMVLIVLVGQNLISGDLRFNAIPLYFSRPLNRSDYFLGKLGVIGFFVALVIVAPAVIAYVLGVCFSMDLSILKDTAGLLLGILSYGLVVTLSAGMLMLALSSLSRNSRYVGAMWIGIWIVGNTLSLVLLAVLRGQWTSLASYTDNLLRIGAALLDTNAAWGRIGQRGWTDLQFPWYWSAAVLAGLFGLSLWILTSRVKSLDRLR